MAFSLSALSSSTASRGVKLLEDWDGICGRINASAADMPGNDLEFLEDQRGWVRQWKALMDEAQSALKIAKDSGVDLPIEFNVGDAKKQFEIWETRIRLHDRHEKEKREKEAECVAASSPAPDGDVEMGVHLPPILAKKCSIVEDLQPKSSLQLIVHTPPCGNCKKKKSTEVLNVEDEDDVDDDATVVDESTPHVRGGRKGKGKAKASSSAVMSEQ
ncbi:hypothetical protein K503DRAFT_805330 [Rhizopogon vinicolor AM-OR11-026]|uniref:Uncharacterized protein n=1 Tax=Rhizopogon vinicolor AM-OR11-026 TaxID=1314800 RepID=A0A1B7MI77_9AGAM|nr:hypothetical protein K503DRAFT_805330 [Rhizopogon vinicolor AM-OR11-026]